MITGAYAKIILIFVREAWTRIWWTKLSQIAYGKLNCTWNLLW